MNLDSQQKEFKAVNDLIDQDCVPLASIRIVRLIAPDGIIYHTVVWDDEDGDPVVYSGMLDYARQDLWEGDEGDDEY